MDRVRRRIGDRRVLALVKAFLKAGILDEDGTLADTNAGTPQGSILSPLLSNVALSILDEHIAQGSGGPRASPYERAKRRRHGLPNYRLARYADDWCLLVSGTKVHAEALRDEIAEVLSAMGLRLSPEKTLITHIDEGLDFSGLAHPAPPETRSRQTLRLPGQESAGRGHGEDQSSVPEEHEPTARAPAASAQPDAAGLDHVLQVRMLERDLQLPALLPVEGDRALAGTQASTHALEAPAPTLRHLAHRGRDAPVRPGQGQREALLLPGNTHPDTMAEHRMKMIISPSGLVESPVR